jgi:hypothetical protein
MATETTDHELAPREDPRECAQERASGTVDLDGSGAGTVTVTLTGELATLGLGLLAEASVDDGTASVSNLSAASVDVDVTGGTADATVNWEVVVSEDRFAL